MGVVVLNTNLNRQPDTPQGDLIPGSSDPQVSLLGILHYLGQS
jgi:hypothetical protein